MSSVMNTSPTLPYAVYNEYELEGGIKVRDATGGRIKAEFREIDRTTGCKVYKILIDGHEVFAPTGTLLQFAGSDSLKFKEREGYFHIKETEEGKVSRIYIDVQKRKGDRRYFYMYRPCLLTEEQLKQRLDVYKDKWLEKAKDIQIVAHNRHGVVIVGWDKSSDGPFYDNKQKPFVAISRANDEKWYFYPGRDFGSYGVMNEADGTVKIVSFTCRGCANELEIHLYRDKDTNNEKIAINSEEAQKLSPEWLNLII